MKSGLMTKHRTNYLKLRTMVRASFLCTKYLRIENEALDTLGFLRHRMDTHISPLPTKKHLYNTGFSFIKLNINCFGSEHVAINIAGGYTIAIFNFVKTADLLKL